MTKRWITDEQLDNWTAYHKPTGGKIALHGHVRDSYRNLMYWLNEVLPESPEKTTALVQLRNAMQAANTCIALNPLDPEVEAAYVQPGVAHVDTSTEQVASDATAILGVTQLLPHYKAEDGR